MACSKFFTNEEIKARIHNIWSKFVLGVDPDRLSDWLVQEHVITSDQWQMIISEHPTRQGRCRALLHHLFNIPHPRAFLVVYQALTEESHYLLELIDNQKPGSDTSSPSDMEISLQADGHLKSKKGSEGSLSAEPSSEVELLRKENRKLKLELEVIKTDKLRCKSDPVLVKTIRTKAADKAKTLILGLTILDKELFVLSESSSEVEVYDSNEFIFKSRWNLKELISPCDLVSCRRNRCLYIFDRTAEGQTTEIHRVDPHGILIKNWTTGDCGNDFDSLSITDESNVILTVFRKNKVIEFSPDGQLIRDINLDLDAGIRHPRHAIKLVSGQLVVSHGYHADELHRVCVMDADGKLEKSFGGSHGSDVGQMDSPVHFSIDENGFVIVADRWNSRILLLDPDLKIRREIIPKEKYGLRLPCKILLDQSNGRLLVADNEWDSEKETVTDGRVLIFDFS